MEPSKNDEIKLIKEQLKQIEKQTKALRSQLKRVVKREKDTKPTKKNQVTDRHLNESFQQNSPFYPQMPTPREQHSPTFPTLNASLLQQGPSSTYFYETSTPLTLFTGTSNRLAASSKCDRCERVTRCTRRGPEKQTYCAACGMEYDKVKKGEIQEDEFIKKIRRDEKGRKIVEKSIY